MSEITGNAPQDDFYGAFKGVNVIFSKIA